MDDAKISQEDNIQEEHIFKSIDMDMIQKSLKGTHVKVHVDNLISPCNDHCIPSLNEHHAKEHAESFEKNCKPFTTLIGHICDNVSTNDLMTPGKFWVETTPERHYNDL
ncbi:uncharacterized protein LOC144625228 [Crassostrea virginica]